MKSTTANSIFFRYEEEMPHTFILIFDVLFLEDVEELKSLHTQNKGKLSAHITGITRNHLSFKLSAGDETIAFHELPYNPGGFEKVKKCTIRKGFLRLAAGTLFCIEYISEVILPLAAVEVPL